MSHDEPTEEVPTPGGVTTRRAPRSDHAPFMTAGSRLRDGRYVLERLLGRGGMAAVWLARDERLERRVAVKMLSDTLAGDEDYLTRFRREAQVAASLSHPNLVQIYDFDAAGPRPCLVMEYVAGGDLGERLERGEAPDPERLARELLAALRQIHDAGVIHRDVKPQNVLIGRDGRARLTDFGIARPRDATSLTQTGQVLGTARYMAPEVLEGEDPTERSDLYSLGVVLEEAAAAHGSDGELAPLIARLRARDPAQRPASAAEALGLLDSGASPRTPATQPLAAAPPLDAADAAERPPAGATSRAGPAPRTVLAGLAALVAAVVAVVLLTGGDDEPNRAGERAAGGGGERAEQRDEPASDQPAEDAAEPSSPSGAELNDQGFALIQQGQYAEAIPILERAVESLRDSGDELTYGYALFNLAHALRLAGRPEEAIPLLEERLQIPNQTDVVQAELEAARADAGLDGSDGADDDSGSGGSNGKAKGKDKPKKND